MSTGGGLVRERAAARRYQAIARDIQEEMALRDRIAQKYLTLHDEETDGRRTLRHEQRSEKDASHDGQAVAVAQNPQQAQHRGTR
ncbi:hypothetical protein [Streptomyces sp. NPDC002845]